MIDLQRDTLVNLKKNNIDYREIINISEAYQIASVHGSAVARIKGILDFLKKYGAVNIVYFPNEEKKIIMKNYELALLFRDIDEDINIESDLDFVKYFS